MGRGAAHPQEMLSHARHGATDLALEPPALHRKELLPVGGLEASVKAEFRPALGQRAENGPRRSSLRSVRQVSRAHGGERRCAAEDEPGGENAMGLLVVEQVAHGAPDGVPTDGR